MTTPVARQHERHLTPLTHATMAFTARWHSSSVSNCSNLNRKSIVVATHSSSSDFTSPNFLLMNRNRMSHRTSRPPDVLFSRCFRLPGTGIIIEIVRYEAEVMIFVTSRKGCNVVSPSSAAVAHCYADGFLTLGTPVSTSVTASRRSISLLYQAIKHSDLKLLGIQLSMRNVGVII